LTFFCGAAAPLPHPSHPAILYLICNQHGSNFFFLGNKNEPEWYCPSEGALLTDSALPPAAPAAGALDIQNPWKGEQYLENQSESCRRYAGGDISRNRMGGCRRGWT
jgi:hypothetical protein